AVPAVLPARPQESIVVLEPVLIRVRLRRIVADGGRDDLPRWQRGTVVDGHDPDEIIRALEHHRIEAVALLNDLRHPLEDLRIRFLQRQEIDPIGGDHDELRQVDGVGALPEDLALRPALPAGPEESGGVLKFAGRRVGGESLGGGSLAPSRWRTLPSFPWGLRTRGSTVTL